MSDRTIDLVYFDGCPNAEAARANLRALMSDGSWREWNLSSADTPERFRRYGSPTVLVDGRDVTGEGETTGAVACRADGAPSPELLRKALARDG
jgi:mercuric ion transport protein